MYEYVDEDGNVIENPEGLGSGDEYEEVEEIVTIEEKKKEKKEKKDKKKRRGVKKTGKEKKGGKITKQYEDDFLNEKRKKKKKKAKTVQVGEFVDATKKVYVEQAKYFLNAFWTFVEEDAEKVLPSFFIFIFYSFYPPTHSSTDLCDDSRIHQGRSQRRKRK